jgi:glycosyltransferase involved in cell wall biosynthesis
VGRYVRAKGVDLLVNAYRHYQENTRDPWDLVCAGAGPLAYLLDGEEGIINKGFVQPDALPELMRQAGAFVLPSRDEPWGVVIHEAATSGLPLLCSDECGAVVHLLQDGYNGWVVEAGNASHLAQCMMRVSEVGSQELSNMGERSHWLSKQFTPKRWAMTLTEGIKRR